MSEYQRRATLPAVNAQQFSDEIEIFVGNRPHLKGAPRSQVLIEWLAEAGAQDRARRKAKATQGETVKRVTE